MKDDRLRISVDENYAAAIGRAGFVFSVLEHSAVWCCEGIHKNYIRTRGKKTAGGVAADLIRFVKKCAPACKEQVRQAAVEFKRLVSRRNELVHSTPATTIGGAQQLVSIREIWTCETIENLTDEFAACIIQINALIHGQTLSCQEL